MTVDPFTHMEEAWNLDRNPFPPAGIRRTDDPFSDEVFAREMDEFRRKLVRGAVLGGRGIGFLWSSGRRADTGYGKTTLMMETAREINADLGRTVLMRAGMREDRLVPIAAAYTNLNNLDVTGLYAVLFGAVVDAATRHAGQPALFDQLRERIASDDPSTIIARVNEARVRTAPGGPPLRPELVRALATDGAAGVLDQLSNVRATVRVRSGLQYLDFLLGATAAAGVDHVFVFVDQLEDLATNKSISSAKRSREIGRIRDLMEIEPYARRLHFVFTFHATAGRDLERYWEQNRLPTFENTPANTASVVDLRGIEDDVQVANLLKVYLEQARLDPVDDDLLPFDPESLTVLREISDGRVGVLLSRAYGLLEAAAMANWPRITGDRARQHFDAAGRKPQDDVDDEPLGSDYVDDLLGG